MLAISDAELASFHDALDTVQKLAAIVPTASWGSSCASTKNLKCALSHATFLSALAAHLQSMIRLENITEQSGDEIHILVSSESALTALSHMC